MPDSTREPSNDRVALILAEHGEKLPLFEDFAAVCKQLIERLAGGEGIRVHSVTCRAKTSDSLRDKLSRPGRHYEALTEVTDLAGVRIITFFSDDVDAIGTIIEREFSIIEDESIDKRKAIDPDRFGYLSLHYVCTLSAKRAALPEHASYSPYKCEIQVRSILQHAWAEIEHDLGYKAPEGIPRQIRRRFSRLAGLLETADDEFTRIRDELAEYSVAVRTEIGQRPTGVLLDKVSLAAFIEEDAAVARVDGQLARWAESELRTGDYMAGSCVAYLRDLGIQTIEEVRTALAEKEATIVGQFRERTRPGEHRTLDRGICLFHLWQVSLAEKGDPGEIVAAFRKFGIGTPETHRQAALEVIEAVTKASGQDGANAPEPQQEP